MLVGICKTNRGENMKNQKCRGWNLSTAEECAAPMKPINNDCNDNKKDLPILEIELNRIYFYSEIERENILRLNKELRKMDNSHLSDKQILGIDNLAPIFLHVNSFGGSIFSGFSGMDNILQCKSPIVTVVDGICASAATFLSVVGKKRLILEHSFMLIHQVYSSFWGKYDEFKDEAKNLDKFMGLIKNVYLNYTKLPEAKLNEILKHDLFFDSKQCIKYGLADEII